MTKLDELAEKAEEKAQVVVTMTREESDVLDDGQAAFAFVLGTEAGDAMIISATISGDGKELTASITSYAVGEPVDPMILQVGNSVLVTSNINT